MVRIGINGFGRIGRLVLRALLESGRKDIDVVAINDLGKMDAHSYLIKYDSVHGILKSDVSHDQDHLIIDGKKIKVTFKADPKDIPWKDLGVDIVFECSGHFTSKESASAHLVGGAKKVIISAPADHVDRTVVYGVNHEDLKADDIIISNASCTTNCLAPVAKVLHATVGIKHGYMTTIHSYTGDQTLVDRNHKDLRRARAGALSLIPTSTGAAKAVGLVLPALQGKLDGTAIRVPTPNVSLIDFKFTAQKDTTIQEINEAIFKASQGSLKGILATNNLPLVSCDFNHHEASSVFDLTQTQVVDGVFVRVLSWYDNEWGFSNRMLDVAAHMARL